MLATSLMLGIRRVDAFWSLGIPPWTAYESPTGRLLAIGRLLALIAITFRLTLSTLLITPLALLALLVLLGTLLAGAIGLALLLAALLAVLLSPLLTRLVCLARLTRLGVSRFLLLAGPTATFGNLLLADFVLGRAHTHVGGALLVPASAATIVRSSATTRRSLLIGALLVAWLGWCLLIRRLLLARLLGCSL